MFLACTAVHIRQAFSKTCQVFMDYYVVDIRNGLYILKYHGPFEEEVAAIRFLEGNSNLGEAQLWELP